MILDCHVHMTDPTCDTDDLCAKMKQAGVDGGIILSRPPDAYSRSGGLEAREPLDRIDDVLAVCTGDNSLFPFFWIDPTEDGAVKQVDAAVDRGMVGFKVICNHHYPGDKRAMKTYAAIAEASRPILFHSGILYDAPVASSQYCRPAGFECLLEIPDLRFALAHISWPWCDELIAVYGKSRHVKTRAEMFVDTTPGTPAIYRRDALTKLFTVGFDVGGNVLFGTDSGTREYSIANAEGWIARDRQILGDIGVPQETIDAVFSANLERFLGISRCDSA